MNQLDLMQGWAPRNLGEPEVRAIIDIGTETTLEFRGYGFTEYRWAYCRAGRAVRWIHRGTLEMDLIALLVNKTKVTIDP